MYTHYIFGGETVSDDPKSNINKFSNDLIIIEQTIVIKAIYQTDQGQFHKR